QNPIPVRWAVLQDERRVGWAETEWRPQQNGWVEFRTQLELLDRPGIPFGSALKSIASGGKLRWQRSFHIAPDGNLHHFDIDVFLADSKPTITVQGKLEEDIMRVSFRSSGFIHEEQFYYEPHSLMTTSLAPIDKLPNLKLGQSWQQRVINPL